MSSSARSYGLTIAEQKTLSNLHSTWPLKWLSDDIKPYAEVIRIHKPAGIMAFYFPCLYSTFLVGILRQHVIWSDIAAANVKLFILSFLMRCTFVTFNDLADQDFDRQVSRTRIRPLARGAMSIRDAIVWNLIQAVVLCASFAWLSTRCATYSIPFAIFHTLYPFAKRLTHHPQLVLGLAFNHGTFLAFPALHEPLHLRRPDSDTLAVCALSAAIFFWTILYDTIYSAQDAGDDLKAGVGSPVLYWGQSLRGFLRTLGILMMFSLVLVSRVIKVSPSSTSAGYFFDAITCGGTLLGLFLMIERVDLKDPGNCGWWFNQGNILIGYVVGAGLAVEFLIGQS